MAIAVQQMLTLSRIKAQYPFVKYVSGGVSVGSLFYAIYSQYSQSSMVEEIEYRKQQLSKPIYELRDEELVSPPWNSSNLHEWLYRPVKITGRPLHYKGMFVGREEFGKPGFENIVPFVTKENGDQTVQEGQLVSLGFVPHEYKEIGDRHKLEDASVQTFTCFVSQMPELQEIKHGNVPNERNPSWDYADLQEMAKYTGFVNANKIGKVVLERVAMNTLLDEKNMRTYDLDADHHMDYPYVKSRSGALYHKNHMPWDWQRAKEKSLASTVVFGTLGVLIHLAK